MTRMVALYRAATTTTTAILVLLLTAVAFVTTDAAPTKDLIVDLPLVGATKTPQYSGYLDATGTNISTCH
jgi:hypothetical protein